jgi:hypothetical protein
VCTCYAPALYGAQEQPIPWAQTLGAAPYFGPAQANLTSTPGVVPVRVVPTAAPTAPSSTAATVMLGLLAIAAVAGVAYYSYRSSYRPRMQRGPETHRPARRRRAVRTRR